MVNEWMAGSTIRISNDDGVLNYIISFLVLGVLGDAYKEATGK